MSQLWQGAVAAASIIALHWAFGWLCVWAANVLGMTALQPDIYRGFAAGVLLWALAVILRGTK